MIFVLSTPCMNEWSKSCSRKYFKFQSFSINFISTINYIFISTFIQPQVVIKPLHVKLSNVICTEYEKRADKTIINIYISIIILLTMFSVDHFYSMVKICRFLATILPIIWFMFVQHQAKRRQSLFNWTTQWQKKVDFYESDGGHLGLFKWLFFRVVGFSNNIYSK